MKSVRGTAMQGCTWCLLTLILTACGGKSAPIDHARSRPVALRFGMYVTPDPEQNPIDPPERFQGYHVGLDYEVFDEELESTVPVYAICNGDVLYSGFADGYGGVLVQRCRIDEEVVTVLYGHIDGEGLAPEGKELSANEMLGVLAPPESYWSGENRKHLHLGIHRGEVVDFRGYVQHVSEIQDFIDPREILRRGEGGRTVTVFPVPEARTIPQVQERAE